MQNKINCNKINKKTINKTSHRATSKEIKADSRKKSEDREEYIQNRNNRSKKN